MIPPIDPHSPPDETRRVGITSGKLFCKRCGKDYPDTASHETLRQHAETDHRMALTHAPDLYTANSAEVFIGDVETALQWAKKRVPVYPLHPTQNTALNPGGADQATIDEQKIREWWTRWPSAAVGLGKKKTTPHAPTAAPRASKGAGLARDPALHLLMRVRIEDAMRSYRDPVAAAIDAIQEHESKKSPSAYRILTETLKVEIHQGAENTYNIHLKRDDMREAIIQLSQECFAHKPAVFVEKYLQHFHERLKITNQDWDLITSGWLDEERTLIIEGREEASDEVVAYEAVLERISRCKLTDDLAATTRNEEYLFWDNETTTLLIESQKLRRFLNAANPKVTIQRLSVMLSENNVAESKSFLKRVPLRSTNEGNKRETVPLRFWRLKADPFGFTIADVLPSPEDDFNPAPEASASESQEDSL